MARGGKRDGAGRKKRSFAALSRLPPAKPEIKHELREIAREYSGPAIEALVKVCREGKSETARVAAASALLDRGYGKPGQHIDVTARHRFWRMSDEELMVILDEPLHLAPNGTEH
jgi:hypothetical protein